MTVQWSDTARNNLLDSLTTTLGAGWKLKIRTGAQPANVATASSGVIIATFTPAAGASAAGVKNYVTGNPSVAAGNAGTAAHYELTTAADVVVERGSITVTGGGGDLTIDNTNVAAGQTVTVTGLTKTAPGV